MVTLKRLPFNEIAFDSPVVQACRAMNGSLRAGLDARSRLDRFRTL
jgi:hypothetical protein